MDYLISCTVVQICPRPTLPRKAKKQRCEAIPIFKRKSQQRRSLKKICTPECSPEVARPVLSGRGVTREEPLPIALTQSLRSRKEKISCSDIDSGKDFGQELPSTRSRRLRQERSRYIKNDNGKDFGGELPSTRSPRLRKESSRYPKQDYAKDFDEEFESEYNEPREGSLQDHDFHPQGREVLGGAQIVSEQSTSETAHPVKSWSGRRRRGFKATARKNYPSMSSPSMDVSLETEGMAGRNSFQELVEVIECLMDVAVVDCCQSSGFRAKGSTKGLSISIARCVGVVKGIYNASPSILLYTVPLVGGPCHEIKPRLVNICTVMALWTRT